MSADMVEPQRPTDLRPGFHSELDSIRGEIAKLSARVTEDIPRATEILLGQDLEGAEYMILADDEVDAKCVSLEERCYRVLALQSPVATDLRQVVAALRIIAEVERSADLAVNICKAARRIYGHKLDPRLRGIIQKMGDQAQKLFREATESYLTTTPTGRPRCGTWTTTSTTCSASSSPAIFESHSGEGIELQVAVQLAVVARFYERIGDHAVNIGERVRYLVTGWMPEHDGAARFATRAAASDLD